MQEVEFHRTGLRWIGPDQVSSSIILLFVGGKGGIYKVGYPILLRSLIESNNLQFN